MQTKFSNSKIRDVVILCLSYWIQIVGQNQSPNLASKWLYFQLSSTKSSYCKKHNQLKMASHSRNSNPPSSPGVRSSNWKRTTLHNACIVISICAIESLYHTGKAQCSNNMWRQKEQMNAITMWTIVLSPSSLVSVSTKQHIMCMPQRWCIAS